MTAKRVTLPGRGNPETRDRVRGRKRPSPGRHRPLSVRPPAPRKRQWRRWRAGTRRTVAKASERSRSWEAGPGMGAGRHEDGAWGGDRARTRGTGPTEPPGWSARGWHRRRSPLRTIGRWTHRRPGRNGAPGAAFAAPQARGGLRGSGVPRGPGRRWALPHRVGARAPAMPNSRVPSPRVPRVPAGGFPVPLPRARLAVGLDTPPPCRGRCRAPDSPCGFGHGLSGRQLRGYRRLRPPAPPPAYPHCPLSRGREGRFPAPTTNRQAQEDDGLKRWPIGMKEKWSLRTRLL